MDQETMDALKACVASGEPQAFGDGKIIALLTKLMASPLGQMLLKLLIGFLPVAESDD